MTDEEVIKALEEEKRATIRINHRFMDVCGTENPDDERFITLLIDTLALINRQRDEIERLKTMHCEACIGLAVIKRNAYKAFGKMLIDKAERGIIHADDIPDYVVEMAGD